MSADYARNHCKIALAKIMQTMGWNSINSTPLEVLTDVMVEYITQISKLTVDYSHEFGQTEPNLDHLGLAFQEMNVNLPEIEEFTKFVNFLPAPAQVPKFPLPKETNLNFLKPGSKEVVTRPVYINEHLPPMYPLLEEEDKDASLEVKKEESIDENYPHSNDQTFKKPAEVGASTPDFKRPRRESEGSRPTREISSVMMTTSGFLSPAREGRLPEAKAPLPPPEPPKPPSPEPVVVPPPPPPSEPPPLAVIVPPPQKKIKAEKKERRLHKELFKPIDQDGKVLKKIPEVMKDLLKMKQAKAAAQAGLSGIPGIPGIQPLFNMPNSNTVPNLVRMNLPGHNIPTKSEVNKTVFNKTLAIAKAKTEKLNTTITPIPTAKNEMPFQFPSHLQVDKLLNQPDKKKINILRKISNKPKQQSQMQMLMPHMNDPNDIVNKINLSGDITIEPINPNKIKRQKMNPFFEGAPFPPMTSRMLNPMVKERKRKEKPEKPPKIPKPRKPRKTPHTFFNPDMVNLRMERPRPGPDNHFLGAGLPQFPPIPNLGNPLQFPFPMGGPGLIPTPLGGPGLFPFSSQIASFGKNPLFQNIVPPLDVSSPKISPKPPKQRVKKEPKPPKEIVIKEEPKPIVKEEPIEIAPVPPTPPPEKVVEKVEKIKSPKMEPMDLTTDSIVPNPAAESSKKTKEHKKEKKDKIKKKKDKKDKIKAKAEKALEKAEKKAEKKVKKLKKEEKEKLKAEKKEKKLKKDIKQEIKEEPKEIETPIPKILLKVNSPSPRPETPETMKKLNIKPIVKKEEPSTSSDKKREASPGLAKISALVTGPPKHKKEDEEKPVTPAHTPRPPGRPRIHPVKPKPTPKPKKQEVPFVRMDSEGNEIWICPSCGQQDDGRPMIGCDGCDAWYHWVCVGIQVPPDENENWYCKPCLAKKNIDLQDKKRKRKKRDKKDH